MVFYEVVVKYRTGKIFTQYCTAYENKAKDLVKAYEDNYDVSLTENHEETWWSVVEYKSQNGRVFEKVYIGKFTSKDGAIQYLEEYFDNIPEGKNWRYTTELHTLEGKTVSTY